jgi:hypothetical protein|tara:strand:- start:886 stop:1500 length:615 start_codon:yes stop_codon:yes gene_type:complete
MGLISGLRRIVGGATSLVSSSATFGKHIGTTAAGSSRVKYLEELNTFSAVKAADKPAAYRVLTENAAYMDEVASGAKTNDEAVNHLISKMDEVGYQPLTTNGKKVSVRKQKNLAQKMISNSKAFRRRKTRFQILGSVAGVGGIMGVAYLICDGVYQAISNALGGALDDVLDKFGESNLGAAIVIGSVVIGSVYILRTTKDMLGS